MFMSEWEEEDQAPIFLGPHQEVDIYGYILKGSSAIMPLHALKQASK